MRAIEITGADDWMDCRTSFFDAINPLPRKCATCGFPDLDYVPQPYFVVKSRTNSPNELALAANGNFFLRPRVRRVLDLVAPKQCAYYPTRYQGTNEPTPWQLAVPCHRVVVARVMPTILRCQACGEPRSAHPGTQFSEYLFGRPHRQQPLAEGWTDESPHDVVGSATWGSSENGWDKWMVRSLFLSVRLFHLLKKIKAQGFHEATAAAPGRSTPPDVQDAAWIDEKLLALRENGVPLYPEGTASDEDLQWLRDFIARHGSPGRFTFDAKTFEKRFKIKLPKSYVDFITKVGPMTFDNVDELEGFRARVVAPEELDSAGYRAGVLEALDEATNAIDGVMFAATDHGDCFCFDVQKGKKEFAVFLYKHEFNCFEPYAANFPACIKRFVESGG